MAEVKAQAWALAPSQLLSLVEQTGRGWSSKEPQRLVALEHRLNGTSSPLCLLNQSPKHTDLPPSSPR